MKVHGGNSGPVRPERPNDPATARPSSVVPARRHTPSQVEKLDRVEISAAGKARAASAADPTAGASLARLAEIRLRVLRGAYDADEVVGEVARRIMERGDA